MQINEEKMVSAVLKAVLGNDKHALHGHVELQSALANEAIQQMVYGLVREDDQLVEASCTSLRIAVQAAIDTRMDDSAFYDQSSINTDPEWN